MVYLAPLSVALTSMSWLGLLDCNELFIRTVHERIKLTLPLKGAIKINVCYVEIQFPFRHFVCSKSYKTTNKNEVWNCVWYSCFHILLHVTVPWEHFVLSESSNKWCKIVTDTLLKNCISPWTLFYLMKHLPSGGSRKCCIATNN